MNPEPKFSHGAIRDLPDTRDFHISEVGFSSGPFDWSLGYDIEKTIGLIPTKNQYASSSCGGQAWSYLGGVLHKVFLNTDEEKSAKFIYAQTHLTGGGSSGRDNCKLVASKGWGTEALTPSYEGQNACSEAFMEQVGDITPLAYQTALKDIALSYATTNLDIDSIAEAIRDNNGCVIGVSGKNNGTWMTDMPQQPRIGDTGLWSHWVYAGKAEMIAGKKCIGIKNSWGDEVGDSGWQWFTEDFFNAVWVWSCWTLVYKQPVTPTIGHKFSGVMSYGQTNEEIKFLQERLQSEGFFPKNANCTGFFGNTTARSVVAYQISKGIMNFAKLNLGDLNQIKLIRVGPLTLSALNA